MVVGGWLVADDHLLDRPMTAEESTDDPLTRTGVLRATFGEGYRGWIWVRNQFTPASLGVIFGIVAAAGGYIVNVREHLTAVTTRVVVLETRVIPVLDQSGKTGVLTTDVAAIRVSLEDTVRRVGRLEQNWDDAGRIAATPNDKLLRQRRR